MKKNEAPTVEQEHETIQKIIDRYADPDTGNLKWKLAFTENPEWQEILGHRSMQTHYVRANQMRGRKKPFVRSGGRPKQASAEEQAIMEQIVDQYSDGDRVLWNKAWAEHPDWWKVLKHRPRTTIYSRARYLKQKRQKAQEKNTPGLPVVADSAKVMVVSDRPVPARIPAASKATAPSASLKTLRNGHPEMNGERGVAYCPKCGEHIAMWDHVAKVMTGL